VKGIRVKDKISVIMKVEMIIKNGINEMKNGKRKI